MRVKVVTPYTSAYPDPIRFPAGATLHVGRSDPEFPGWFWCRTEAGREGWVHHSFLADPAERGGTVSSVAAYSAHELTVQGGEIGTVLQRLDGWARLRLDDGEEGWIPLTCLALAGSSNRDESVSSPPI